MKSIWVVTHDSLSADLVAGARALAPFVGAVTFGGEAVPGADLTVIAPQPPADVPLEAYARPIADRLAEAAPDLVLCGADLQSRLLAGLIAARLKTGVRNATSITVAGDAVTVTRSAHGGLAVVTETLAPGVAVLVIAPGTLPVGDDTRPAGDTETLAAVPAPGLKVTERRPKPVSTVNLATASRVVGVGRGFAAEADLELARALAAKLGAEVGCSRPIAEGVGWLPGDRYLGVSGATIKPDVYVAIGISGQVQHMAGVGRAKVIVAINKDQNAPIFAHADYGIVGDLYEVVPALTAAL
ncbi:MAG: electron transfer flavoprotein subunit alpha/FixB family protein [Propionibacteriaceae bacterium]|jgi:electron transfer flavoprotein alpha subunit|nr:electron transfer flavoprotein subunit alpha/FixB family protein [Propionibacteriaceae bacterium]